MENQDLLILIGELALGLSALGTAAYYAIRGLRKAKPTSSPASVAGSVASATSATQAAPSAMPTSTAPTAPAPTSPPELTLVPPTINSALRSTRESFWGKIQRSFSGEIPQLDMIEEILYTSDLGSTTVTRLLETVESELSRKEKQSIEAVKDSLKGEVRKILTSVPRMGASPLQDLKGKAKPQIWMIVGVNGVGKTTTIGKLAHLAAQGGARVLVAAGDTFRAAAQAQLKVWTERAQVEIFAPEGVTDPGAVAFDAIQMAKARGYDLVLIDTAGRLHTQTNLMEELKKVKRVMQKLEPQAPHETLIVLDANSGQNALVQAERFDEALKLSGAVFTKMDGTAKGGVVLGLASALQIPTVYLGIGENMQALTGFDPAEYAEALFDSSPT